MAGLFASMAVKLGLDKLSSFLRASLTSPPTASSSSSSAMQDDLEDLRSLERTMRRIRATLQDAEEHWNIREESAKLRLEELKEVAYDAEDVVDEYEYEYEVKLEALELSAGVQSSNNKRKRHEHGFGSTCSIWNTAGNPLKLKNTCYLVGEDLALIEGLCASVHASCPRVRACRIELICKHLLFG